MAQLRLSPPGSEQVLLSDDVCSGDFQAWTNEESLVIDGTEVVYLDDSNQLMMRSEVSGATEATGVMLYGTWQRLRWCGTIGGTWSLGVDGVDAVAGWSPDTGSDPIGRFQIGTSLAGTITVHYDDVVVTTR